MMNLILFLRVSPEKVKEFRLSVESLTPPNRPGTSGPMLFQAVDDCRVLCCIERWDSEDELREYLGSEAFRAFRGAVATLGSDVAWHIAEDRDIGIRPESA